MEADLQRWYGLDIRDRWHPDPFRRLTLRRISVLLRHLPPEAAVLRIDRTGPVWGPVEGLLADIWQQVARSPNPHPMVPTVTAGKAKDTAKRDRKKADAEHRAAERRRLIDEGVIT